MNVVDRPYRDKKVIKKRDELVAKEKAREKKERAERLMDRCHVCGSTVKVVPIRIGSVMYLCPRHFGKLLATFNSFVLRETALAKEKPDA